MIQVSRRTIAPALSALLVEVQSSYSGVTVHSDTASCPGGKRAVASGGENDNTKFPINDSKPTGDGSGWTIEWYAEQDGQRTGNATVWALCVPGVLPAN